MRNNSNFTGSTVVYPHDNKSSTPIEIGGSIFVRENKIMMRAANEFNLTIAPSSIDLQGSDDGDRATGFGIWDGEKFVFTSGTGNGMFGDWWDNLKILWRYGIKAPLKTRKLYVTRFPHDYLSKAELRSLSTSTLIDAIYTLYPSSKTYETMEDMSAALNFTRLIAMSTTEYLDLEGVSKLYSREIVEAISRVSYGQVKTSQRSKASLLFDALSICLERRPDACYGRSRRNGFSKCLLDRGRKFLDL
jgi:prenylcysteine oxidase/farnesylcysteine lyase